MLRKLSAGRVLILSRLFCALTIGLTGTILVGQSLGVSTSKRFHHVRLRAQIQSAESIWQYDRWFVPGALGFEPAVLIQSLKAQSLKVEGQVARRTGLKPTITERAYLTRAFGGGVDSDWGEFNGLGKRLGFSHNLSRVFPATLFDTHPEFFPLIEGERWRPKSGQVNWNPDLGEPAVAEYAATAADKYFGENPDTVSFALGVNDGLRYGESLATLKWVEPMNWFRNRPDYSDLVFQFMNAVAERTESKWPDKKVGALAYYWTENVPSFPLHSNVLPYLTADRSQFYDQTFKREELELQKRWGKAHAEHTRSKSLKVAGRMSGNESADGLSLNADSLKPRLGLYDYIYGYGFLIPRIHTRYLAEHLRHARRAGFTDYYAEVYPNWGLDGPQPWLVSQLLMDPEQDAQKLLREYYTRYFRQAARPMRRFFERCEAQWRNQSGPAYWLKHFKNDSQAEVFPSAICRELRALLDAAARAAQGDPLVEERVRLVSGAFGLTERYVTFCEARNSLQTELWEYSRDSGDQRSRHSGKMESFLHTYREARSEFVSYGEQLEVTQPLAINRWEFDFFLRHDPGPTAEQLLENLKTKKLSSQTSGKRSGWEGVLSPALEIAGLPYSVALPRHWRSSVEPWQGLIAEIRDLKVPQSERGNERGSSIPTDGGRVLRLENNKLTSLTRGWAVSSATNAIQLVQWGISLQVRGRLSESAFLSLTLRPYDSEMQPLASPTDVKFIGKENVTDWRTLAQFLQLPERTRYVGLTLWCAHQQVGDWLEVGEPRVIETLKY